MLVLRRRAGEALLIGDEIEIQFLEIGAQAVKIGIQAPKQVTILRKELQITRVQNQAAAQSIQLKDFAKSLPKIDR